jgi:hypothetical protein
MIAAVSMIFLCPDISGRADITNANAYFGSCISSIACRISARDYRFAAAALCCGFRPCQQRLYLRDKHLSLCAHRLYTCICKNITHITFSPTPHGDYRWSAHRFDALKKHDARSSRPDMQIAAK